MSRDPGGQARNDRHIRARRNRLPRPLVAVWALAVSAFWLMY